MELGHLWPDEGITAVTTHYGIDFAHGSGLTVAQVKAAGKTFVARYLSWLPNSKVINKREYDMWIAAGIDVVLVWEFTGTDFVNGFRAGAADAAEADKQAKALGAPDSVIYFAIDRDTFPGDRNELDAYFAGARSKIGLARTGEYAEFEALKWSFDYDSITFGWQTYAWSGGQWEPRAQLRQYLNGVKLGPATVDLDKSDFRDFGQNPRPKALRAPVTVIADGVKTLQEYSLPHANKTWRMVARTLAKWPLQVRFIAFLAVIPHRYTPVPKGVRLSVVMTVP